MSQKVMIGMSGGVDSSVAAYLLKKQGYVVTGFNMRLFDDYIEDASNITATAQNVADKLGINFISVDCRKEFHDYVVKPFIETYEKGMTPNPCIECNRCIKFNLLSLDDTIYLATGHYACVEYANNRWKLKKSSNLDKDQSYFLYTLSQDTLARVIFPLGQMDKSEVRKIAEEQQLINAHKKDSQDICFITDGDHAGFIRKQTTRNYPDGNFVDTNGNVLGRHKGLIKYTVGQRKGLGLALKKPMYVLRLDADKNEVVLADNEDLFTTQLRANKFNWVSISNPNEPFRALGRIRYRHKEAPCTVTPLSDNTVSVVFDEPQRAITAGQSFVLYDIETDSYVLGGGIIID